MHSMPLGIQQPRPTQQREPISSFPITFNKEVASNYTRLFKSFQYTNCYSLNIILCIKILVP